MNQFTSKGDAGAFAQGATQHNKAAIDLCEEDGRLRAFKYLLMRLTVGGLRMEEVPNLRKIGEAVFAGADPDAAARKVLDDASASPLAVVIANAALKEPDVSRQRAVLGAVLGAHASVGMGGGGVNNGLTVYAAVIGSATAETTHMIDEFVANHWEQFGTRD